MRNNGEEIKIHQHDNYQMAGTFKNMGDTNQNQPMKGYGHDMQPGKISGGAAQYIKDSYSAAKMKHSMGATKPDPDPDSETGSSSSAGSLNLPSSMPDYSSSLDQYKIKGSDALKSSSLGRSYQGYNSSQDILDQGSESFKSNVGQSGNEYQATNNKNKFLAKTHYDLTVGEGQEPRRMTSEDAAGYSDYLKQNPNSLTSMTREDVKNVKSTQPGGKHILDRTQAQTTDIKNFLGIKDPTTPPPTQKKKETNKVVNNNARFKPKSKGFTPLQTISNFFSKKVKTDGSFAFRTGN